MRSFDTESNSFDEVISACLLAIASHSASEITEAFLLTSDCQAFYLRMSKEPKLQVLNNFNYSQQGRSQYAGWEILLSREGAELVVEGA